MCSIIGGRLLRQYTIGGHTETVLIRAYGDSPYKGGHTETVLIRGTY